MLLFSFLAVINAIIDPSGNLDLLTNNKTCSVLQPEAAKVRTTNNTSGSVLESLSPVKKMNYIQKSNFGSTGLQDKTFVSDGEKYVIWQNIFYCLSCSMSFTVAFSIAYELCVSGCGQVHVEQLFRLLAHCTKWGKRYNLCYVSSWSLGEALCGEERFNGVEQHIHEIIFFNREQFSVPLFYCAITKQTLHILHFLLLKLWYVLRYSLFIAIGWVVYRIHFENILFETVDSWCCIINFKYGVFKWFGQDLFFILSGKVRQHSLLLEIQELLPEKCLQGGSKDDIE